MEEASTALLRWQATMSRGWPSDVRPTATETEESPAARTQRDQRDPATATGPDPDWALVLEATSGSVASFEALVRQYQVRIVNYATAILKNTAEAEDVAQETFLRAYRALHRFRGESSFKTWLYTIATNTARSALDRRSRHHRMEEGSLDDETRSRGADELPAATTDAEIALVLRQSIDHALATLSGDLRVAVVLRDVEGLDYKEIATVTGVPIGTVESRIFRARRRLRRLLEPLVVARSHSGLRRTP